MDKINWVQILIGFLGGGAIGALIKQFFDYRKHRIQPIGRAVEVDSIFVSFEDELLNSEVILTDSTGDYTFKRLYNGKIQLINTGSTDYSSFIVGLELPAEADFIQFKVLSGDMHHTADITGTKPELSYQTNKIEITLKPFNRKDKYDFEFLITSDNINITAESIKLSSPTPTKWINLINTTDMILEIAKDTFLKVGPLTIGYNK